MANLKLIVLLIASALIAQAECKPSSSLAPIRIKLGVFGGELVERFRSSYYALAHVGEPKRLYSFNFDTVSRQTWIQPGRYTDNHSKTMKVIKENVTAHYKGLDSDVEGTLVEDSFHLGVGKDMLRVDGVQFINAHDISGVLDANRFDGFIGLGYENITKDGESPAKSVSDLLFSRGVNLFSFWFSDKFDQFRAGELVLNGIPDEYRTGDIFYVPILDQSSWTFMIDSIDFIPATNESSFSETKVAKSTNPAVGKSRAILTPTHSLISGPEELIAKLNNVLGTVQDVNRYYMRECVRKDLPILVISLNNGQNKLELTADDYLIQASEDASNGCYTIFNRDDDQPSEAEFHFGTGLMIRYLSIFDRANNRIGFAPAKREK